MVHVFMKMFDGDGDVSDGDGDDDDDDGGGDDDDDGEYCVLLYNDDEGWSYDNIRPLEKNDDKPADGLGYLDGHPRNCKWFLEPVYIYIYTYV